MNCRALRLKISWWKPPKKR